MSGLESFAVPLLIGAGSTAASAAFGRRSEKPPEPPPLQPPVRMPDPNDPATIEAERRKRQERSATKGRSSTDLYAGDSGPTFLNDALGQ